MIFRVRYLRPIWFMAVVILGILMSAQNNGFAQELSITRQSAETLILGQDARWNVTVNQAAAKPTFGRLPSVLGANLTQTQDEIIVDESTGLWQGRWTISLEGQRVGRVELPPLTIHVGSETHQTASTFAIFNEDRVGGDHAFLEWKTEREYFWQGEVVEGELRFGFDIQFFASQVLQPFRRPLDIPVKIKSKWLITNQVPLTNLLGFSPVIVKDQSLKNLVVNDELTKWAVSGEEERDGQNYRVVARKIARTDLPIGLTQLPLSFASFFYATEFEEDFLQGRVAKEKLEAFVYCDSNEIQIRPLPEIGRPDGFSGAVGDFHIELSSPKDTIDVGQSLELVLRVSGRGDSNLISAPVWRSTPGLRFQGVTRSSDEDSIFFAYDLVALSPGVKTIRPIEFSYFDPKAERFVLRSTARITIDVAGDDASAAMMNSEAAMGESEILSLQDGMLETNQPPIDLISIPGILLLFLPLMICVVLLRVVLIRDREIKDPAWAKSRRALRICRNQIRKGSLELGVILADYLAAKLALAPSQVYGPNLYQDLIESNLPKTIAQETRDVFNELTETRYGGPQCKISSDKLVALVSELETEIKKGVRS